MGDNPYLQATAQNVAGNMANAYETGTRATRDAQAARMGGYGSSGWDAQRQRDEGAFAQQLGNTMNQLYGDDTTVRPISTNRVETVRPISTNRA